MRCQQDRLAAAVSFQAGDEVPFSGVGMMSIRAERFQLRGWQVGEQLLVPGRTLLSTRSLLSMRSR